MHARVWDGRSSLPLILVAGLGVSSRYWVPLGRRLAGEFRILAPDLPGFGRSPKPPGAPWPGGPSVRQQADHLLAWMDARGIDRAHLCGHSVGAQIVAEVAARFPQRVEKLILAAPTYERGQRRFMWQIPRLLAGALFETPSLDLTVLVDYASVGPFRVVQQAMRSMADPIESNLPRIEAPTLVVRGAVDPVVTRAWAREVAAALPQSVLVEIGGAGHAVQFSAAAVTARVVRDFLCGRLNPALPPPDGAVVAPIDDPRRDSFGPPQPIAPAIHAALDGVASAIAVALSRTRNRGGRASRSLMAAAGASLASNLITDHRLGLWREMPMVTHANLDLASGAALLIASAIYLRHECRAGRRAVAALGAWQVASALLTAKPTGPATARRP
jgi:pimeloyl-ACP methyl ester carboxylesterase